MFKNTLKLLRRIPLSRRIQNIIITASRQPPKNKQKFIPGGKKYYRTLKSEIRIVEIEMEKEEEKKQASDVVIQNFFPWRHFLFFPPFRGMNAEGKTDGGEWILYNRYLDGDLSSSFIAFLPTRFTSGCVNIKALARQIKKYVLNPEKTTKWVAFKHFFGHYQEYIKKNAFNLGKLCIIFTKPKYLFQVSCDNHGFKYIYIIPIHIPANLHPENKEEEVYLQVNWFRYFVKKCPYTQEEIENDPNISLNDFLSKKVKLQTCFLATLDDQPKLLNEQKLEIFGLDSLAKINFVKDLESSIVTINDIRQALQKRRFGQRARPRRGI